MASEEIFAWCVDEALNKAAGKPSHEHLVEGFSHLFARFMKALIVAHEVDRKGNQVFVVGSPNS